MLLSNCAVCNSKKSTFIKEQWASRLLSSFGIKTPLIQMRIFGPISFWGYSKRMNKFLSAGDIFMPEMHLRQPRFTYSTCGPFNKNKERIGKFKKTGDSRYIY